LRSSLFAAALLLVSATALAQQTRHPSFANIADSVPDIVVDMRYFGERNFVGRRIDGYEQPVCLLTREAAHALANVQRDLVPTGLGLKVFDCYRPARAVASFVRWGRDLGDQRMKSEYYPDVDKRKLFRDGYIAARSGHSRGSTVDLTLVRLSDRMDLDMGSPFDFFGTKSWPSDRTVSADARVNRRLLAAAMQRRGFRPYDKEWWHFTLSREPFPETYFDFPVR
jgi:D-alanyl-D-alanine dipeptidase